jgi:hypothetical protein
LLVGFAILGLAYLGERRHAADLAAENSRMAATLSQTQSQLDTLTARVNAMTLQATAAPSPSPTTQPLPEAVPETHPLVTRKTTHKARQPLAVESRHWKKFEAQLAEHQKAIAGTQQELEKARTDLEDKLGLARVELNGSIARTHDELVALEKKGERDYYEFHLQKSKEFQHAGPLNLSLRKTNTKHAYYDLTMLVDDRQLDKKHVNLYEPLLVYPADKRQPFEVVVNQITKNGAHGYVSAPKYTESQTTASGAASTSTGQATARDANGSPTSGGSSPTQDALSHRPAQPL